jgi:hypothetical protein
MRTIFGWFLGALVMAGCSASADGGNDETESADSELRTASTVFHGTIKVSTDGVADPGSALDDPSTWDGTPGLTTADLVAPASLSRITQRTRGTSR